jgi:hypothetical protein
MVICISSPYFPAAAGIGMRPLSIVGESKKRAGGKDIPRFPDKKGVK